MHSAPFGLGALTLGDPRLFDACVVPIPSQLLVHPCLLAGFRSPTHTGTAHHPSLRPAKGLLHRPLIFTASSRAHPHAPTETELASTLHLNSLNTQAGQPQDL